MIKDDRYFCRRSHARTWLKERYQLDISRQEYDDLCREAVATANFRGTNIKKVTYKGVDLYCTVRRDEIATFLTAEQAESTIETRRKQTKAPQVIPLVTLEEMLGKRF